MFAARSFYAGVLAGFLIEAVSLLGARGAVSIFGAPHISAYSLGMQIGLISGLHFCSLSV